MRIEEITGYRGCDRPPPVHVMFCRGGYQDTEAGVPTGATGTNGCQLRLKRPRTVKAATAALAGAHRVLQSSEAWSRDFVADARFDGRKLHMLTVVDCYMRECLANDVG